MSVYEFFLIKSRTFSFQKNCFDFLQRKPFKNDENAFYFKLKALFVLGIITFFNSSISKLRSTWKFMTSQTGQQIIAILILPNISRSKGNLTIKFDNSIVYNMLNLFLEKLYTKCDRKATPRPFYRDTKFSISLDHQPEMLWSLFLLYVKSWSTNYTKIKVLIIWSRICWDETSTRPAGTDFTLRLHGGTKFHPGKTGQFSTWYLHKFVYIFL